MANEFARFLRKNLTDAEAKLWKELRRRQFVGCKFRRQAPLGVYIVDFVCFEKRLILELDGGQHNLHAGKLKDAQRPKWLESQGFKVLRFWNHDVFESLEAVLEVIFRELNWLEAPTPHPNPPPQGGRE